MTGLAKLIAAQKAKTQGVTNSAPPSNARDNGQQDAASQSSQHVDDSASIPQQQESDQASANDAGNASANAGGGTSLGRLNLLRRGSGAGGSGGATTPKTVRDKPDDQLSVSTDEGIVDGTGFSLDDIAGFDESVSPVVSRGPTHEGSGFLDEIEATAPDRDLPPDLEITQLAFVEQLDNIYQIINDPELFGQSVRIIMMELQENPEYIKLISDTDVATMIRAMRNTMGLARIKKQSKSRTAKATTAAKKKGTVGDKEMGMLDSLLGGGDDDDD